MGGEDESSIPRDDSWRRVDPSLKAKRCLSIPQDSRAPAVCLLPILSSCRAHRRQVWPSCHPLDFGKVGDAIFEK